MEAELLLTLFIYFLPLVLGIFVIWIYRTFVDKDSYCRDFISGLIMVCATREFLRNFRVKRSNRRIKF
jgi:hypothetical protein